VKALDLPLVFLPGLRHVLREDSTNPGQCLPTTLAEIPLPQPLAQELCQLLMHLKLLMLL
jgi:hypothetical protein